MQKANKTAAIIVAAGQGKRYSDCVNKMLIEFRGKKVFEYSLDTFQSLAFISQIILVGNAFTDPKLLYNRYPKLTHIVPGGDCRQKSVLHGLSCTDDSTTFVFVHDAARPLFTSKMTKDMYEEIPSCDCVIPLLPIYDAVKEKTDSNTISPVPGKSLFRTQTPQLYHRDMLMKAFREKGEELEKYRDEMEMVKVYQPKAVIKYVEGDLKAEKITTPGDIRFLESLLPKIVKTGIGYDFHPFVTGRPLVLGGCVVPYSMGLEGDSDGDVLSHSILDSLLGALSLGDIGRYIGIKTSIAVNAKSLNFLNHLMHDTTVPWFQISHIDSTIICKEPTLNPWIENMVKCIADVLALETNQINIKSTTDKGVDGAGEGKGIRVISAATIEMVSRRE
jgi:2-C-methyl-D-erythritol 4-phosphate cytidylyltransferase/2-C-methyl-D-erythritol 2,4-cyclodiphosphate synthase